MTKKEVRQKLSKYTNGGNAFLVLDYLLDFKQKEIAITQETLATELNKTRPAILSSLELLVKVGVVKMGYGRIEIIKEIV